MWSDGAASASAASRTVVVAYCQRAKLYSVVKFLKASGAAGIIVDRGEFIFEGSSPAFETLVRQALKARDAAAKPETVAGKARGAPLELSCNPTTRLLAQRPASCYLMRNYGRISAMNDQASRPLDRPKARLPRGFLEFDRHGARGPRPAHRQIVEVYASLWLLSA